jgi:PAS domain S-box-containing protein
VTHRLLARQLERVFGRDARFDARVAALIELVDATYRQADEERRLNARVASLASDELREANTRWQSLLDALPDVYLDVGPDYVVRNARGALGRLGSKNTWSMIGKPLEATCLGPLVPSLIAARAEADQGCVLSIRLEDGPDEMFVDVRLAAIRDGGTAMVLRDVTREKLALRAEQEVHALFSATIDSLPAQIAILDGAGQILSTNRAWEAAAVAKPAAPPALDYFAVCPHGASILEQHGAAVAAALESVLLGARAAFDVRYEHGEGGKKRHYLLHVIRVRDAQTGRAVVVHEDVSAVIRSELQVRENEKLLRTVLQALPVGVLVFDQDARLLVHNVAAASILGGIEQDGGQRVRFAPVVGGERDQPAALFERVLDRGLTAGETTIDARAEISAHDGARRHVTTSVLPIYGGQRSVSGCVMVLADVTANRNAELAVRRSERQQRAILDSVADGILVTRADGEVAFANRAGTRMLGRSSAEIIGHRIDELISPRVHELSATGEHCVVEESLPLPTHERITCEFVASRFGSENESDSDAPTGAVVSFRDVTQRLLLQQQLAQAQKLEAIGSLAAGIAHEINTPMQYISDNVRFLRSAFADIERLLAAADALLDGSGLPADIVAPLRSVREQIDLAFLRQESSAALDQCLDGVDRVSRIVYSMKEFAHPDRNEKQAVDLNKVVRSAATVCRSEWKYVAEVAFDLDETLAPFHGFAGALSQVVLNLIINSAHAIAERMSRGDASAGLIRLRTRCVDDACELTVEDNGCGIRDQDRSRIFEQFFTTKPVGKGTGQGLALVRRIVVERHGGTIDFDSWPGKGARFRLRLPTR